MTGFHLEYNAEPTLAQFHASDAFIRGVRGPWGSGKSVGVIVAEALIRGCQQEPGSGGRRRTRGAIIRNCFDDQTEILTETRGFVLFKDLGKRERVAMLDGEEMVWIEPSMHYQADYVGEMIGFENEGVDFLVTPDHRLNVSKQRTRKKTWGEYEFKTAAECYGSMSYRVKRDARWKGVSNKSEAFFEWLGFWFAEGSAGRYEYADRNEPHWRCVITQSKDKDYVRDLFKRAGLDYTETTDSDTGRFHLRVTPETKPLIEELAKTGGAISKRVPFWIRNAPEGHLGSFIKGFVAGDGSYRKDCNCMTACTASIALANDLQEMALKAGMVANITLKAEAGQRYFINGNYGISNSDYWCVTFVGAAKHQPVLKVQGYAGKYRGWHKQQYHGKVYCLEVPTHRVYVRRNGKAHWSSQTYGELKSTTIATWQQWIPQEVAPIKWDEPITCKMVQTLDDGTVMDMEVLFIACDRPAHIKKMKGLELTWAALDEACELDKSVLDILTARIGRYPSKKDGRMTWCGVMMDTNSMDDDHWYHDLEEGPSDNEKREEYESMLDGLKQALAGIGQKRPLMEFFVQPPALIEAQGSYVPNPEAENIRNLQTGFGYYLQLVAGKSKDWIDMYVLNKFGKVIDGKPVYPEYNEQIHGREIRLRAIPGLPITIGLDFGLSPAAVPLQVTSKGQLLVLGECVSLERSMGFSQFYGDALKPYLINRFGERDPTGEPWKFLPTGDPAGSQRAQGDERTVYEIAAALNWSIAPAKTNAFQARREALAWFLNRLVEGQPAMLIDSSAKMFKKGLRGGYHYRRVQVVGEARYQDIPYKNKYSHVIDGAQYGALQYVAVESPAYGGKMIPDWQRKLHSTGTQPWKARGGRV